MSSAKKQGRAPVYDTSLKITVAREYLTSNLGYGALAQKYHLPSASTVRHFVKWYRSKYTGNADVAATNIDQVVQPENKTSTDQDLKAANLKIAGLEMLIEIAQKELGIDIVKKPGTKQSRK